MARNKVAIAAAAILLGLVAGAMIVKHTVGPVDPARLRLVKWQLKTAKGGPRGEAAAGNGRMVAEAIPKGYYKAMVASRAAVRGEEARYTLRSVFDQLLKPYPKFSFQEEWVALPPGTKLNETEGEEEHLTGWDDVDAHLWSEQQPGSDTTDVELVDIITSKLPLFITAVGSVIFVELTAVMQRRGRDLSLALSRGRPLEPSAKAQVAKESQWMLLRPFATGLGIFCIFCVVKDSIDVFDKCFWNWACWADLDCNLRILTPAVAECTADVVLPAILVSAVLVCLILGFVWSCTRPGSAAFLIAVGITGLIAISTISEYVLLLWLLASITGTIFWFVVLPSLDPATVPSWAEDLGSLSASTDLSSGALRDGDRAQPRMPLDDAPLSPSSHELGSLGILERCVYHVADFVSKHLRYFRTVYNGCFVRPMTFATFGRRVRIHGEAHVATIASHDSVLLAGSGCGRLDLWVAVAAGLWPSSGCGFFTVFLASYEESYSSVVGALVNVLAFASSYFPPRLGSGGGRVGEEGADRWNAAAKRRALYELRCPSSVVVLDTEGVWGDECGDLALSAAGVFVVPVHVEGLSDDFWGELWKSVQWNAGSDHPVHVSFGPPISLAHIRGFAAAHLTTHGDAESSSAREVMREGVKEAKTLSLDARFGGDELYQGRATV